MATTTAAIGPPRAHTVERCEEGPARMGVPSILPDGGDPDGSDDLPQEAPGSPICACRPEVIITAW